MQRKGTYYSIISGLLYGFIGFFGMKILVINPSVNDMLFWRFAVASCFMLPFTIKEYIENKNLDVTTILIVFLLGAVFYSSTAALFFHSGNIIGTGLAMVLFYAYPIFVALLSWKFHGITITLPILLSLIMMVIGAAFIAYPGGFKLDMYGLLLGIISAIVYAFYVFFSKNKVHDLPPYTSTLMVCLGNMFAFLILAQFDTGIHLPLTKGHFFNILALGVLCSALPILFLLQGLRYISARKASILSVLEPVATVIVGVILLNESITYGQILGIILILLGAIIVELKPTTFNTLE